MQRVALARALVTEPKLLLLDEPMSNLDAALRASLRGELKLIQKQLDQSVLYVTHDQIEAMSMSDRIAVMREGKLEQLGTPDAIYNRPATRFVAEFIGDPPINMLACTVRRSGSRAAVTSALGEGLDLGNIDVPEGTHTLGIRPHDLIVAREPRQGHARTTIRFLENLGAEHVLHLDYGGGLLAAVTAPGFATPGEDVWIDADARHLHVIRNDTDQVVRAEQR
jgi:ABC-type sugar transport system ATPase subunit